MPVSHTATAPARTFRRLGPPPPSSPEALAELTARLTARPAAVPASLAPSSGSHRHPAPGDSAADWAGYYTALKMRPIPIPPGTKAPALPGWPSLVLGAEHWRTHPDQGIGILLGASGLASLDIDDMAGTRALLESLGLDLEELTSGAVLIQGRKDRLRAWFRLPEGAELSRKALAWPAREPGGKPLTIFELRAGACQDLAPPSLHPEGHPYTFLRAPWELAKLGVLPEPLRELWEGWDRWRPLLERACPWAPPPAEPPAPTRQAPTGATGLSVVDSFNQAHDVGELLRAHGYRTKGPGRWIAPSSESGLAGVVLLPESGRVFSHHASDPLGDGLPHDPFDCYRILEHGGDHREAVKAAARLLGLNQDFAENGYRQKPDELTKGAFGGFVSSSTGHPTENFAPEWTDPEPLPTLPSVPEFEPGLLPESFRGWLMDIAERTQCPPDFPAVAGMVGLATVVGRQCGIRPKRADDWLVVPNLWGAIVGRPGTLKSPALSEPLKPLRRLEGKARESHTEALREHEASCLIATERKAVGKEAIRRALKQNQDPASLAWAAAGDTPAPPTRQRYLTSDSTVEALGEVLAANPRGLLVFRDELTGLLRSLDREGQETSRAFYLESWNATDGFTYDRISRGTIDIPAVCLSVLGGIQPGPLGAYLSGAIGGGGGDDGLLQRFQLTAWPDVTGEWRDVDRWPDSQARGVAWSTFERLDRLDPHALGAEQDKDDAIPFLRFDDAAQELFREWRGELERRLRAGDEHPALEAHLAKYRSLVPSLALLRHLADHPEGGPVGEDACLAACAWAEYLEGHARRLYAPATAGETHAAKELLRHLIRGDLSGPFTVREVTRKGWRGLDRTGALGAMERLAEHGYLAVETRMTGGRPSQLCHINPGIGGARP
jgi:hypothetical protein